nr:glycosyltransferase family 2 protein [Rhodovulum imhoffii]
MRLERQGWRLRARRKSLELTPVADRTDTIAPNDVLVFMTLRNELLRLPFFLNYYRERGIAHFLIIDNGSDDGSQEYLAEQPDISLWSTRKPYGKSHYGVDWLNWLLRRKGSGHWCLTLDADEFLVYPFEDSRPIPALTDWLDQSGVRSFGTLVLDMYPKGPIGTHSYKAGENPFGTCCWFDSGNYVISRNPKYRNLWIQGGARARMFFTDLPQTAPALNKIPLVRWEPTFTYISSTHMLLPRGLNLVYDQGGGEKASGCLLHAKFLEHFTEKSVEETQRRQHYASAREYHAYSRMPETGPDLWTEYSDRYLNWRQLEILGLMSKGNWA